MVQVPCSSENVRETTMWEHSTWSVHCLGTSGDELQPSLYIKGTVMSMSNVRLLLPQHDAI